MGVRGGLIQVFIDNGVGKAITEVAVNAILLSFFLSAGLDSHPYCHRFGGGVPDFHRGYRIYPRPAIDYVAESVERRLYKRNSSSIGQPKVPADFWAFRIPLAFGSFLADIKRDDRLYIRLLPYFVTTYR
ncbi:hypothetical protein PC41400_24275 [Paenibacillus chitinolyticus]|uniref:Uncharacterized protein n=1 Tax=Paenibacillus chitinolyticus TaxID=79263 RepID=A0A410X1Y3_9BACL|nr:hypothetical protein PC41400_24275 [Paenibacillus chitinolyticus]